MTRRFSRTFPSEGMAELVMGVSCARQFPLSYKPWFLSFAGAESMPIVTSDRVTRLPALPQRRASAQLFAQARHAPDQTGKQPQHLYCPNDLTAPTNPPCF